MRMCRKCGFPRRFARYFDWRSDGTILSTDFTHTWTRICFLELGELESILKELSDAIGVSIDRFIVEAHKNIGKVINANLPIRHIKRIPSNRLLRPQWFARALIRFASNLAAGLGDGRISVDEYRAGVSLVLRISDPCLYPMLVGSALGIYESVEEMPAAIAEYGIEDGDLVIRMRHARSRSESERRLFLEEPAPGVGPLSHERCTGCGAPLPASRELGWDVEKGVISNLVSGNREVVVGVESVNATLRELEKELGEEISSILFNAQKRFSTRRLELEQVVEARTFWDGYLADMALRGLGFPHRFTHEGSSISVEISNAYNQDLYAAKLSAAMEKLTGGSSVISWQRRERHMSEYTISEASRASS